MRLLTKETTLTEFKNTCTWLIQGPATGRVYVMRRCHLNSGRCYMYIAQKRHTLSEAFIRVINSREIRVERIQKLLHSIQTKQFEVT